MKYFVIFALLLSLKIYAQEYSIRSYSVIDELKGTYVWSGFQDSGGFLWFATQDGVFRFDGKRFNRFNLEETNKKNTIFRVFQDSKGFIWFVTQLNVQRFDGKSVSIYNFPNGKKNAHIKRIFEDTEGRIWFWGRKDILFLKNFKVTQLSDRFGFEEEENLIDIVQNAHGELLFFTNKSVKKFNNEKFTSVKELLPIARKSLYSVILTKKGELWSGDRFGNILIYHNGKFHKENIAGKAPIENINEDSKGNIWISSAIGLFKYNSGKTESFKLYKDSLARVVSFSFEDKEGNIWVCAQTGVHKIQRKNFLKVQPIQRLALKQVIGIVEDNLGQMWFGSESDGVFSYDGKNCKKHIVSDNPKSNRINSVLKSRDGSLWFATDGGLLRINNGVKKLFTTKDGLQSNHVHSLIEDKNGNLWFRNDFSVLKFDGNQFSFPFGHQKIAYISRITSGFDNEVWIGYDDGYRTSDGRIVLNFKNSSDLVKDFKHILFLKSDNEKSLWVGISEKGFSMISPDGRLRELISKNDGLLSNSIYGIFFDKNGYLWIGTGYGISRFDVNRYKKTGQKIFENYRNPENEITAKALAFFEDSKNNIWVGTTHGVIRFDSQLLNKGITLIPPQIHLTGIKLFLDRFNYLDYSDSINLKTGLPSHLKLPFSKNYLTFEFIGLNYTSPEDIEYKYRLNGFDSTWSPIVKVNEVTYTNLSPGSYKFEVMARNKDGLWSISPSSISFIITPPFWKTWWFYVICFAFGSAAVFGYIRVKTRNLERQKLELENTVDLRTKELQEEKAKVEEVNRELEKSRYQLSKINELQAKWLDDLSESEKQLMEINTNKDKLFSIISHDLKSPFRSLLMYSESMLGKLDSLTVKEIKEYTEEVHRYSENIYRLLEDLLEWSRIQIGRMEFEPKDFSISNAVMQTLQMLRGNAEKKNIILKNNVPEGAYVFADENMIKSILNNLISNAIKFTDFNGLVEISAARENGSVIVSVCDNGIGMSENEMIMLFKIEKHFHKPGTANEKGTGLGLILCKELIEKNEGTISVQSVPGKGTNFIFTVPSAKD